MSPRLTVLLLCLSSLLPCIAASAAPSPPSMCSEAAYRQFDFWLGEWTVTTPDGQFQGHNRVEKRYGDCVVQENWTGSHGGTGSSFNIYDANRKVWHQSWVDSSGTLLLLEGGLKDGRMVLSGTELQKDGKQLLNRITWTPGKDMVPQTWETSSDNGKTWKTIFDGIYKKAT
jgi:hypothetical protein